MLVEVFEGNLVKNLVIGDGADSEEFIFVNRVSHQDMLRLLLANFFTRMHVKEVNVSVRDIHDKNCAVSHKLSTSKELEAIVVVYEWVTFIVLK